MQLLSFIANWGWQICTDSHSPLLCISLHHGRTSYTWEKCQNGMWERINVSSSCCLIFVSCAGTYRCSSYTEDTTDKITFEVTSMFPCNTSHLYTVNYTQQCFSITQSLPILSLLVVSIVYSHVIQVVSLTTSSSAQ